MRTKLLKLLSFPVYPLFFAVYPVLNLLGNNISQVHLVVLWRPLGVIILVTCIFMPVLYLLYRDWHRAAVVFSLLALLFFSYGHLYGYLKTLDFSGFIPGRHRYLSLIWGILFFLVFLWGRLGMKSANEYTRFINLLSIGLLVYPTTQTVSYLQDEAKAREVTVAKPVEIQNFSPSLGYAPDIYFIVLDAYGRSDILRKDFEYDNSEFLSALESRGFYVAECSQSNYAHTILSLPSILNFNYLDDFDVSMEMNASLQALARHNYIRKFLEASGYTTVAFATNYPYIEWTDADYFLTPPPKGMNDFELLLAQTTAWRIPLDLIKRPPEQQSTDWYRRRTVYALKYLDELVPEISSPKFVYTHLVIPHHPFVFGPNGEEIEYNALDISEFSDYVTGYNDQVTYVNKRIITVIDKILATSPNPPIIVIQGDHGPTAFGLPARRLGILNAYYFPNGYDHLYKTITPVNTFRVILDDYFNEEYELLDDRSYYSLFEDPYNFELIDNTCAD